MRLRHGSLTIDVPDDWRDETTLVLVGPPPPTLPTAANVSSPPAVTVRFTTVEPGTRPADVLRAEGATGTVISEEPITSGLGSGWLRRQTLPVGDDVAEQWVAAFCLGSVAIIAVASAAEGQLDIAAATLRPILESLATSPPEA